MKSLKITLLVATIFTTLVSCTKQDLSEDDVLQDQDPVESPITGGQIED